MMFLLTCDKKLTKSQLSPTHASTCGALGKAKERHGHGSALHFVTIISN